MNKHHQAEKPIALYEYLIRQMTEEYDVCLDQFGGSCNMLKAATNLNRYAVVYELCHEFVEKAKNRFGLIPLFLDKMISEGHTTEQTIPLITEPIKDEPEQISLFAFC